jgi:hypothetical protein
MPEQRLLVHAHLDALRIEQSGLHPEVAALAGLSLGMQAELDHD